MLITRYLAGYYDERQLLTQAELSVMFIATQRAAAARCDGGKRTQHS
jgi:hypothetical protein